MSNKEKTIRICTDITVQAISNAVSTACDLTVPMVMVTGNVPLTIGATIAGIMIKRKSRKFESQSFANIIRADPLCGSVCRVGRSHSPQCYSIRCLCCAFCFGHGFYRNTHMAIHWQLLVAPLLCRISVHGRRICAA